VTYPRPEIIYLGPVPGEETCAQVGEPDYHVMARDQCRRYIKLIREVMGPEPEGARLVIRENPHDHGTYLGVVCEFSSEEGERYALRCEWDGPTRWDDHDVR
jgi:hypothetical protein